MGKEFDYILIGLKMERRKKKELISGLGENMDYGFLGMKMDRGKENLLTVMDT